MFFLQIAHPVSKILDDKSRTLRFSQNESNSLENVFQQTEA